MRAPIVLFSLTIHEFMHAYVALRCGDDTAYRAGRVTLNPLAHLDFVGTLCLFFAPIGWAKPVPVNPYNFNDPRRDDILVSIAGVSANFAAGIVFAVVLRLFGAEILGIEQIGRIVFIMLLYGCLLNFGLATFNLLPIAPLDGSHVLRELLPPQMAAAFVQMSRYGVIILVAFVVLGNRVHFSLFGYERLTPLDVPLVMLMDVFAGPRITGILFGS
jgi:Zn-dependent protease